MRLDEAYRLTRQKHITQGIDQRADGADGRGAVAGDDTDFETPLPQGLQSRDRAWQHAAAACVCRLEGENHVMRLPIEAPPPPVPGLAEFCGDRLDHL